MVHSRLLLLPALMIGALAVGAPGCASGPKNTGFDNGDGGGGESFDEDSGGGTTSSGSSGTTSGAGTSSGSSGTTTTSSGSSGTTSGSTSGTTTSSSGSSGGTTSSGSSSSGAAAACNAPTTLIDGMTGMNGAISANCGRVGFWYTYDDGTSGGTLTPAPMMPFPYTMITGTPPTTTTMAAMMSGMGFTTYGAGMGFDLNDPGGTATKAPYNASMYSGITFWVMGSASGTGMVRFNVPDKYTDPSGGICSGSAANQCNDHHGHVLTLTSTWTQVTYTWAELTQQGYGYVEANIDTSALVGIQFQVGNPTGTFQVWVTDVAFTM